MGLERNSSYHVLTTYIPYGMIVCVSWAAFWIKQKDSLLRIGITLVTLLTLSAKSATINEALPAVAYTKVVFLFFAQQIDKYIT